MQQSPAMENLTLPCRVKICPTQLSNSVESCKINRAKRMDETQPISLCITNNSSSVTEVTFRNSKKLPSIDYVLVYKCDDKNKKNINRRKQFESGIRAEGLRFDRYRLGCIIFVCIYCPFDRLCKEAEIMKLEMNLKNCAVKQDESMLCKLKKLLVTDDEVNFVSGPFIAEKLDLYDGSSDKEQFFRSSLRSLLAHHILINLNWSWNKSSSLKPLNETTSSVKNLNEPKKTHGLLYLLMKGVYFDAFILHDQSIMERQYLKIKKELPDVYESLATQLQGCADSRMELHNTWTKVFKFQPLRKIRNYFGEEIAFFYSFKGFLITALWIPALFGMMVFCYSAYLSANKQKQSFCKCNTNSTLYGERNAYGVGNMTHEECERVPTYKIIKRHILKTMSDSFNNDLNPYFALFICIWSFIFLESWKRYQSKLAYEWNVRGYRESETDRPEFRTTQLKEDPVTKEQIRIYPEKKRFARTIIASLVMISLILGVFLSISAILLLEAYMRHVFQCLNGSAKFDLLKHKCIGNFEKDPVTCLILVTIVPSITASILVLVWNLVYSKISVKLTQFENHQTDSEYKSSLILKLFVFEFVNSNAYLFYRCFFSPEHHRFQINGLFRLGSEYVDTCNTSGCLPLVALQLLILMVGKPCSALFADFVMPFIKKRYKKCRLDFAAKRSAIGIENRDNENSLKDVASIRRVTAAMKKSMADDNYLFREWTKPPLKLHTVKKFNDTMIQFGYIVMFAAAFPLAPFIVIFFAIIDLRLDAHRLLWFNRRPISFIASDIGMWLPIMKFVMMSGIVMSGFLIASETKFGKDMTSTEKCFIFIAFEHFMFIVVFLIDFVIPDVPKDIQESSRRETYQVARLLGRGRSGSKDAQQSSTDNTKKLKPSCRICIEDTFLSYSQMDLRQLEP